MPRSADPERDSCLAEVRQYERALWPGDGGKLWYFREAHGLVSPLPLMPVADLHRLSFLLHQRLAYRRCCLAHGVHRSLYRKLRSNQAIGVRTLRKAIRYGLVRCAHCGASDSLTVDHIVPVSKGGGSGRGNLQVLCSACNQAKGNTLPASRTISHYAADARAHPENQKTRPPFASAPGPTPAGTAHHFPVPLPG